MRALRALITGLLVVGSTTSANASLADPLSDPIGLAAPVAGGSFDERMLREIIDSRLTSDSGPVGSGLVRVGPRSTTQSSRKTFSAESAGDPFYYSSDLYNPGDLDGDSLDDLVFYGVDQDLMARIIFYRGVDGTELWSWARDFSGDSSLYFDAFDLAPNPGKEILTYRLRYIEDAETGSDLFSGFSRDHLIQEIQVLSGVDGTELWRSDRTASFTTSEEVNELPWTDHAFEIEDLITSLYALDDVDGNGFDDVFMAVSTYREANRKLLIGLGIGERSIEGTLHAAFLKGDNGEEVVGLDRVSNAGMPFADAVGDLSGDGNADVMVSLPTDDGVLEIEAATQIGEVLWSQTADGEGVYFAGLELFEPGKGDVIGLVVSWVDDPDGGHAEFKTFARRGLDGALLWELGRTLKLIPIGDANNDGGLELLLTDTADPAEAETIEAVSGKDLARLWGPVEVAPPAEGKQVSGYCLCPSEADLDGDGIEDVVLSRNIYGQGSSQNETVGISGRSGEPIWTHSSIWTAARPIPQHVDINGNGTSDLWSVERGLESVFTFWEGADASPIEQLRLDNYWRDPIGANLTINPGSELILHYVKYYDINHQGYEDRSAAYTGQQRLWEISHL